jgi:hypothetical protein
MYIAFFLHEDEEGELQNRLETLWIRLDDLQGRALSKHTVFLKELLKLLNRGFDSLLGPKLFSLRSAIVTLCYSLASLSIFIAFLSAAPFPIFGPPAFDTRTFLKLSSFFVFLVAMGTSSIAIMRTLPLRIWAGCSLMILVELFLWARRPMGWDGSDQILVAVAVIGGIACDLSFIVINRAMIRFAARFQTTTQIIAMLACNLVIAFIYLAPLWLYPLPSGLSPRDIANAIASTNLITALLAFSVVALMLVALVHRIFWPLLSRPIYAISRHQLVRKPALLLSVSVLLLTWAVPAWKAFWEEVGRL